jgi:hypothetical protein
MGNTSDYYVGLLTGQYALSVKAQAKLRAYIEKFRDIIAFAESIDAAFDLDLAVGVQLDVLGEIVGIPRTLPFQPNYGISPVLTDTDYRTLIKATIGKNQWDGQQDSLYPLWGNLFPGAILAIHDNHWMDMDVFVQFPNESSIFLDLVQYGYIVPRPQAVLQRIYVGPPFPLFGFDYDDPYVSGLDVGNWWKANNNRYPAFGFDLDTDLVSGLDEGNWWIL